MTRLEQVLKASLQDVLKTPSKRKCLEDVFKMSWRRFCKTSWRRFEDVLKTYDQDEYIGLDQEVLKTYQQGEYIRFDQDVFKTSSDDEEERRLHQDECLLGGTYLLGRQAKRLREAAIHESRLWLYPITFYRW